MKVENNKLTGEGVQPYRKSPNTSGKMNPDTIIIHYTASPSAESAIRSMTRARSASAHICVDVDGKVTQMVDFNTIAWHAGTSSYKGRTSFNKFSIGIEIQNLGWLKKVGDKFYDYYKREVPKENVHKGKHRNAVTRSIYWQKYSDEQLKTVKAICEALMEVYNIEYILGHEEIAVFKMNYSNKRLRGKVGRKQDPGPAFPLDELRDKLLNKSNIAPETFALVTTEKLNLRDAPKDGKPVLKDGLSKDAEVELMRKWGDWYKVRTEISGWVSKEFLEQDNSDSEWDAEVSANSLNIRSTPDGEIMANPLLKGTKVIILDQQEEWSNVLTDITGWLHGDYIKIIENEKTPESKDKTV